MTTDRLPDTDVGSIAAAAGLRYTSDEAPGISRRRRGTGFSYHGPRGGAISDTVRARIDELAVPPAWTDVWISPDPDGHLLATGRDDRDRKQYLYHERWREVRDEQKFERLVGFADGLIDLRKEVAADLRRRTLDERRVVAAVIHLLDRTLIRIGNERYAAENETFGLTTLEPEHVRGDGPVRTFEFVGKGGSDWQVEVSERRVVSVIDACLGLGQPQLFAFRGADGRVIDVTADHVNERLRSIGGPDATAKTFRTWGGTVVAVETLAQHGAEVLDETALIGAVDAAAEALGNTRAVCRACYVAPRVFDRTDRLDDAWRSSRSSRWRTRAESATVKLLT
ncbi:MAG: hypothetical protein R8G01_05040 [Ilumatobacteraceae bacterium]|nr:hypothetical protein [Ilumatobacteraceae bacterium]